MNVLKTCLSCALILIGSSALPVQKEVISTRLVTRWELEFVSLKLPAAASKLPCQESGTLPEIPSLSLVTRYEIPKRPMGTMRLSVNQPKIDCENGLISLYNGLSPSLMTISAISDQTCLSEAALRLYINIGAKEESTSSAVFHTTVYPEQTTIEWKEKFLLDDTGNSILRLKWRVSCGHYTPDNHQRLKRQIPDSSDNGDNATDTNSTTIILNPVPGNNDTLNSTLSKSPALSAIDNSTDGVGNNSQTDTDALGSGEPTESFVTGIRKTSETFKEVSNLLNLPSSTPTDPLATAPSVSPVPPVINPGNPREDNLVKQTTVKINAPAAGDGENTDPLNKLPDVKTEDLRSTQTTTPSTTPKPTGRTRPGDRKDPSSTTTTATTATAKPSSSVKPSIPSTTTKSTRRTRPGDKENPKTITPSISTTTKQPNRPANGDGTTASTSTSAPASTPTSPGDKEDTKSTPKPTTSTRPPHRTRPGDKPLETLAVKPTTTTAAPARTRPTDRTLTQAPTKSPSTSPPRRTRPGDKPLETPAVKPTTTTAAPARTGPTDRPLTQAPTKSPSTPPRRTRPGDKPLETPAVKPTTTTTTTTAAPAGTRPTDRPLTPPITKKDVIFTAPKPSPTYPDTSNEPYIGKTGETSSAGRVDKGPNLVTDDATDEATVWPIVMGLVVGIPTIIVISIAITVVHKKVGQPKRTMSSPGGYFERKPPQVPFVTYKAPSPRTYSIEGPPTDIEV